MSALPCSIRLPAVLDATAAIPLLHELIETRGAELTIDGADVTKLGGQCLQILFSAAKSWGEEGLTFELINPSTQLLEQVQHYGLNINAFSSLEHNP
ncbi:MAG: hypothetical protein JWL62_3736 [Hyphomicrobiales bacterium]|nr:hypothetical protein [Hyphomicrobiales bacterium]